MALKLKGGLWRNKFSRDCGAFLYRDVDYEGRVFILDVNGTSEHEYRRQAYIEGLKYNSELLVHGELTSW